MLSCVELDKLGVHKNADSACGFAMQNLTNRRPNQHLTRATAPFPLNRLVFCQFLNLKHIRCIYFQSAHLSDTPNIFNETESFAYLDVKMV